MGIFRKDSVYFIDYYVNGRRRREKIGSSRKLAETVLGKRKESPAKVITFLREPKGRIRFLLDSPA